MHCKRKDYEPFIRMLASNMRQARRLAHRSRHGLDAVCGGCLGGLSQRRGVCALSPRILMAIVAFGKHAQSLFSDRRRSGHCADEMARGPMERYGPITQRAVLREGTRWPIQVPQRYIRHALATVTTHDLPPLKSCGRRMTLLCANNYTCIGCEQRDRVLRGARTRSFCIDESF